MLKMEILILQCANETTQTTISTTLTTTFCILVKTFEDTICKLQREQPVYRFKTKFCYHCTQMKQLKQPLF